MRLGTADVLRADARHLPIPDRSVDLVVTSPPYLNLRSYQDAGAHYQGQIGSEATRGEFIDSLVSVMRECARVLKPSGSIFVNLGDSYSEKSLQLTPERFRIACVDQLGFINRANIVWSKPNGLPESVTDRVRRSHEDWMHFTLSPRYFSAVDEIREQYSEDWGSIYRNRGRRNVNPDGSPAGGNTTTGTMLGKLPGSVWTVPTEPLRVPDHLGIDHFAAFPTEFPKRIIAGWSPAGVCVECGEGRRPVAEADREHIDYSLSERRATERVDATAGAVSGGTKRSTLGHQTTRAITGYACACPTPDAPTTPAVVLDPFGGTGTVAMVAKALGRHGISVDMSADYCRLATWRTQDRDQLAKVLGIEKAPPVADDEQSLLDLIEGGAA